MEAAVAVVLAVDLLGDLAEAVVGHGAIAGFSMAVAGFDKYVKR